MEAEQRDHKFPALEVLKSRCTKRPQNIPISEVHFDLFEEHRHVALVSDFLVTSHSTYSVVCCFNKRLLRDASAADRGFCIFEERRKKHMVHDQRGFGH